MTTPQSEPVRSEVADGIFRVTINRPEKRNALGSDVIAAIGAAFRQESNNETIRAAMLVGAGDKAFAAGGNLRELAALREEKAVEAFCINTRQAFDAIRDFPVPVVAAINGDALGGGAELAMACDMQIIAPHASLGFLQGALAITTAWGGGSDLLRLVGSARGLELLMTSRRVSAEEALAIGLVNAVATQGQTFGEAVDAFLATFAHQRPQVARGFKALARAVRYDDQRAKTASLETRHHIATWLHDDHWQAADRAMARMGSGARRP